MKARLRWALIKTTVWTAACAFGLIWADVHTTIGHGS